LRQYTATVERNDAQETRERQPSRAPIIHRKPHRNLTGGDGPYMRERARLGLTPDRRRRASRDEGSRENPSCLLQRNLALKRLTAACGCCVSKAAAQRGSALS